MMIYAARAWRSHESQTMPEHFCLAAIDTSCGFRLSRGHEGALFRFAYTRIAIDEAAARLGFIINEDIGHCWPISHESVREL